MNKAILRREAAQRRDALADREAKSLAICERIIAGPLFRAASAIHCYLPMRSEVDTRPLILSALAQGKRVAVPVVALKAAELGHAWLQSLDAETLTTGGFGTAHPRNLRPSQPGEWDLIIVPLLAFDRRGHRLGYGKGHYDRLLATATATTVGAAFAAQELAALPAEPHDITLGWVATERELIDPERV